MNNLPSAFKSKRLWIAIVGAIVSLLVAFVPELAENQDVLIQGILAIVAVLIGGYSVQDAVIANKTGISKYDDTTPSE